MIEEHRCKIRLFRNVGTYVPIYAASHPKDRILSYVKKREWPVIKHLT